MNNTDTELNIKTARLVEFLDKNKLDGVWLQDRNNFAWITCGRDNHIPNTSPVGVTGIYATRDRRICMASTIEAPRMMTEELAGTGIETVVYPWWDQQAARKVAQEVMGGKKVVADTDVLGLGLASLPADWSAIRWSLTDEEVLRYRDGARRTVAAMEMTCRQVDRGMTEHEIAGMLDHQVHAQGANPTVTLVAADDRIGQYRHPIPTGRRLDKYVMLVSCAELGGLVSCLTRFVHFGPVSDDLKQKHNAICNIDAAVNLSTQPGRSLGDIFRILQQAYADNGAKDQWQLHHQGGSTGYAGREVIANPDTAVVALENQAFAWNPSTVGIKSEDTVLCTSEGIEVLTTASEQWPMVEGRFEGQTLARAGILVR
jgi:Xaa-Pro aminopeptidase